MITPLNLKFRESNRLEKSLPSLGGITSLEFDYNSKYFRLIFKFKYFLFLIISLIAMKLLKRVLKNNENIAIKREP